EGRREIGIAKSVDELLEPLPLWLVLTAIARIPRARVKGHASYGLPLDGNRRRGHEVRVANDCLDRLVLAVRFGGDALNGLLGLPASHLSRDRQHRPVLIRDFDTKRGVGFLDQLVRPRRLLGGRRTLRRASVS